MEDLLPTYQVPSCHGFTVCDTCTQFKEKLQNLARRPGHHNERNVLRRGFGKHLHHVYSERGEYRIAQTMAIERPKELLYVIIDGADQAKFALPRFATKTKRETGQAMKQKVTGVLFKGGLIREDFLSFLTSADSMPSGANQTIGTFCRALFVLVEKREAQGLRQFPADLFIQLENTAKDNKNRFFLAFCELMIHIGLFSRVAVNCLPVGHTHEYIDRKFSRVSVFLRNRTTATISDLHEALKQSQSCKVPPYVSRVEGMNNFSGALLDQKLVVPIVENMLTYRKFVFERDLSRTRSQTGYYINCLASHNMSDKREEWSKLARRNGFFGVFLKKEPGMRTAPAVKNKALSRQYIDDYKKRVRLTDVRLKDNEKVNALRSEIDRIEKQRAAHPEWDFSRIKSLAAKVHQREYREGSGDDSDDEFVGDGCEYEVGEMVTVNCGSQSTAVTPFWLGRIENISRSTAGEISLLIWWYENFGADNRPEPCYTGRYRSMKDSRYCNSEISSSSVLVYFESLNASDNRIPGTVQRFTREALSPFKFEEE